jgi:hypothetical protein
MKLGVPRRAIIEVFGTPGDAASGVDGEGERGQKETGRPIGSKNKKSPEFDAP